MDWEGLSRGREGCGAVVGFDVGKQGIVGVVHWEDGQEERPGEVENPGEIRLLVERLASVAGKRHVRCATAGLSSSAG